VLIVEENPVELRMFNRALKTLPNCELMSTASVCEAGFLTRSFAPDVILLSVFLHGPDRGEIVKLIRSDPELKGTKILAISSAASEEQIQAIKAYGVDDFIQRPVSPDELRERVLSFSR
jgi:CheY-like chemotaxis protein